MNNYHLFLIVVPIANGSVVINVITNIIIVIIIIIIIIIIINPLTPRVKPWMI